MLTATIGNEVEAEAAAEAGWTLRMWSGLGSARQEEG